ncbi:unnamed protein product [Lactuca virosa]|uniref:Uncharacterized protein n=1 Tax=Lactuca virosa TaxID=75947 RepID=A0AAU9PAK8_9ASTR|nr:unnamed protein product [Lactuca virosa]
MAYRRRQGFAKDSTSAEEFRIPNPDSRRHSSPTSLEDGSSSSAAASATPSLAAKAIRASSANRDSALSSAYGQPAISPRTAKSNPLRSSQSSTPKDDSIKNDYTSMKNLEKPKPGFWGGLARKARSIIEDDDEPQQYETPERRRQQMSDPKNSNQHQFPESHEKTDNPGFQKGLGAIASSLNYIGNALEEGRTIVENKTADIIQETRKLHVKKKSGIIPDQTQTLTQTSNKQLQPPQPLPQTDVEIQLKASRDVRFQWQWLQKQSFYFGNLKLETGGDGDNQEDDDLIRLQLESLLAEKARLAQENSVYARENRFLREIVEYHQLTMQDVVYIDENNEQVYQLPIDNLSSTHDLQLQSIIIPTLPSTPPNTNSQIQYLSPKTPFAPNTPFM